MLMSKQYLILKRVFLAFVSNLHTSQLFLILTFLQQLSLICRAFLFHIEYISLMLSPFSKLFTLLLSNLSLKFSYSFLSKIIE